MTQKLELFPPAPRRPSVIVAMDRPVWTPPLTDAEIAQTERRGIPVAVITGMYAAAWARAEFCPLTLVERRLEPHSRYTPSEALSWVLERGLTNVVAVLGFGVPIALNGQRRAFGASWPLTICTPIGAAGRN